MSKFFNKTKIGRGLYYKQGDTLGDISGKPDIIDNMPIGVLIVDENMKVIRFNGAMAEQFNTFLNGPLSEGIEFSRIMADEKVILMLIETISGKLVKYVRLSF